MKKILLTITAAVLASVGFAQLSGTYTVNGGSATGGTNYQTFAAAFSALTPNGVSGPVTFNCIEGTYNGQVYMSNASISGTSTTNTVTFQADAGNTNEVLWQHTSYPLYMYNTNLNNVSFDGLHMKTSSTYSSVVYMYRGLHTNLTWENCTFTGANTTSTSTSYSVIYAFYTSPQNVTFSNNTLTGGSNSFCFYRPDQYNYTNTCSVNLEDNEMTSFYYRGMYLYGHYSYHTEWHITGNSITG